jgi:hypothetical protein
MSDIVFIGTQDSRLTSSQVDKQGNKYFGTLNTRNECILIKKTVDSESSIVFSDNIVINQIEVDDKTGNIYLKCLKSNFNDLTIGGKTYGSKDSLNSFITLNPDMSIKDFDYIDGIVSFYVSNSIVYCLLFIDHNIKQFIIKNNVIQHKFDDTRNGKYDYIFYSFNNGPVRESTFIFIYSGGDELINLFNNVYISKSSLIVTGRLSKPVILKFENNTINLEDSGEGVSLVLSLTITNNKIIYDYHDIITKVHINKIFSNSNGSSIYLLCDILENIVKIKTSSITTVTIKNPDKDCCLFRKGILKLTPSTDRVDVICVSQSNTDSPVYMNRYLNNENSDNENFNIYYVTQTDNNGNIIINNEVYKTNKLRQLVIKFDNLDKFQWIKELKTSFMNNHLVKNIISYNENVYILGIANNNLLSLGTISYESSDNQNKIYALEFTNNKEQFTNLTSESEFTPSEILDLISITVDKPVDKPAKNSNKIGIIIGSTIGGVLLILISVLLYLHFIKKAF